MRHWLGIITTAAVTVLIATTAAANVCVQADLPAPVVSNFWYCENGSDTAVVFVHGLNSDSRKTWLRSEGVKTAFWPGVVLSDRELELPPQSGQKPSVYLAGYYAAVGAGVEYGMEAAANSLWRSLSQRLDGRPAVLDKQNILFVAHSLGGVLLRDVLLRNVAHFTGKRLGLLLVASPSRGSAYAAKLLPPEWIANSALVKGLQPGSSYLTKLDGAFTRAIISDGPLSGLRGREIYEHRIVVGEPEPDAGWFEQIRRAVVEQLAKTALRERVVEPASATGYFPEPLLIPETNHVSIAHPTDLNHKSHRALREVFLQMLRTEGKACDPPHDFRIIFDIRPVSVAAGRKEAAVKASFFELIQLDPTGEALRRTDLPRDPLSGFYRLPLRDPPFACPGECSRESSCANQ